MGDLYVKAFAHVAWVEQRKRLRLMRLSWYKAAECFTSILRARPRLRPCLDFALMSRVEAKPLYAVMCAREQSPGRVSRHGARVNSRRETRRR